MFYKKIRYLFQNTIKKNETKSQRRGIEPSLIYNGSPIWMSHSTQRKIMEIRLSYGRINKKCIKLQLFIDFLLNTWHTNPSSNEKISLYMFYKPPQYL